MRLPMHTSLLYYEKLTARKFLEGFETIPPSDRWEEMAREKRAKLEEKKKQINSMIQILDDGLKYKCLFLVAYGITPTLQSFPSFGRVYATYGGVFVVLAVLWGMFIDKKTPDMYDWIEAAVCVVGVSIMLWAPRS